MSFKHILAGKLRNQLEIEMQARDLYRGYAGRINDEFIRLRLNRIIREEEKHVEIVKNLIKRVGEHEEGGIDPAGESGFLAAETDLNHVFSDADSMALISPVDRYMHELMKMLKTLPAGEHVVYLSYNKIPKYTRKIMGHYGINLDSTTFLNASTVETSGELQIPPTELIQLSVAVKEETHRGDCLLVVDTLTGFSTYHSNKTIPQFLANLNDDARSNGYKILWVMVEGMAGEDLTVTASQLCDKTIHV